MKLLLEFFLADSKFDAAVDVQTWHAIRASGSAEQAKTYIKNVASLLRPGALTASRLWERRRRHERGWPARAQRGHGRADSGRVGGREGTGGRRRGRSAVFLHCRRHQRRREVRSDVLLWSVWERAAAVLGGDPAEEVIPDSLRWSSVVDLHGRSLRTVYASNADVLLDVVCMVRA